MKRRRRTEAPALTLAKVGIPGVLAFFVGPEPAHEAHPQRERRWPGYREYLRDYRAVRAEFRRRFPDRDDAFAERLHQRVRADRAADVEALGADLYDATDPDDEREDEPCRTS